MNPISRLPGTIAFLGTGAMGFAMASRLLRADRSLRVWNRTAEKARPLEMQGAVLASTAAEAAQDADVIISMLEDTASIESTVVAGGILEGTSDEACWLQMATIDPAATERFAAATGQVGRRFVDAPVIGTKGPAEQGNLVVLVGGKDDAIDAVEPVLEPLARRVIRTGAAGSASRLKLVVNAWLLVLAGGLAESLQLAGSLGVASERFLDAISGTGVDTPFAQTKGAAMLAGGADRQFAVKHARKDALLALRTVDERTLPLLAALERELRSSVEQGHGDDDIATLLRTWGS